MTSRGSVRAACASGVVLALALGLLGGLAAVVHASADTELAAARDLIAFVPADARYSCTVDPDPVSSIGANSLGVVPSVVVGVRCDGPEGIGRVEYFRFATRNDMLQAYEGVAGNASAEPIRSTAGNCPSKDVSWDFGGKSAGEVSCDYRTVADGSTTGEKVLRVWTDDAENILGYAETAPGSPDAVALRTWWNDQAGPLERADDVSAVVASGTDHAKYERALLARIPAATRKTCQPFDLSSPLAVKDGFYGERLWIRGAVQCQPTGDGPSSLVYASIAPGAVNGYFASYAADAAGQEQTATTTGKCPDHGTWSQGKGAQAHVVGEYACTYVSCSCGTDPANIVWSQRKLGVVAFATNTDGDASALLAWWNSSASGPQ